MQTTVNLTDAARDYLAADLCVLAAKRTEKRPYVGRWKQYLQRRPTQSELSAWMANHPDAICIVCGGVSGNLEIIDFDAGGASFEPWYDRIDAGLRDRLVVEQTPSGGYHVVYRCEKGVCGSLKLAQRKHAVNEADIYRNAKGIEMVRIAGKEYQVRRDPDGSPYVPITLIETRGEGGLFVCAPTPGYEVIQGDLCCPPLLTEAQRDELLAAAWELNEYVPPPINGPSNNAPMSVSKADSPGGTDRPGDDFNARGDVRSLLRQSGWELVAPGENERWRRPGKTTGISATLKDGVFYVFSTNATPFEANRAYSPFAVYAHLAHGGDFEQAARTLRDLGYGGGPCCENAPGVDISAILHNVAARGEPGADDDDDSPAPPQMADPGPIPAQMLRMPGFVSEVMDHCLATAPYPNPVMAFAGALSLLAFLSGRKVRDGGDNRTNLYLLGLAHSAAGKDWPRKINTRIIHQVGLANCLGERFASGEGIQDALFQTPAMLFQTDEIDGMLQSINKARDARHEAIMSTLLTMYSTANSVYPMRRKAGKDAPGVIDQPHLVIFGTAIPNHYYDALSERMLTNGFFARTIVLEAGPRGPGQEPSIAELPPRVLATAKWWADYQPGTGNLLDWHPKPAVVEHSDDARRLLDEARRQAEGQYADAEARCDAVATTVWGRVNEQVRKLALLYAVSEDHLAPRIGSAAVEWASALVMHQTRRMLFMAGEHVADTDFEALIKKAVAILRSWHEKRGRRCLMQPWEFRRRLGQRPSDFKDIVTELDERQIAILDSEPGKTKPKTGYRLL